MIRVTKPSFKKTGKFLRKLQKFDPKSILEEYGRRGVIALANATPKDTGETAAGWDYKVEGGGDRYRIVWTNSKEAGGTPLVLLLQYGHATKSGWFISGRDFINPALKPVYDALNKRLLKEVLP